MQARMVVFFAAKQGNEEREWEDGAAGFCGGPGATRNPRFAVADGATQGFDSARWAETLVSGFVGLGEANAGAGPPALHPDAVRAWAELMQTRWHEDRSGAYTTDLERLKAARVGSFATFLGCELSGLGGPSPRWSAVALGDTVLFHVRGDHLLTQFPQIAAADFGFNPAGLPTRAEVLPGMLDGLAGNDGPLASGDRLYLATDALAQWMVTAHERAAQELWAALARLEHPETFRKLVADRRHDGEMENDDVTLMRIEVVATAPAHLVVCL